MRSFLFPWLAAISCALAEPILPRQSPQQVDVEFTVSDAQFRSFENPSTLEQYVRSKGYGNLRLNYNQLSQGVASVDNYFSQKAAQTSPGTSPADQYPSAYSGKIQTITDSTSLKGGPSYTNVSLNAAETFVQAISFSNGDAATAGGAIQLTQTVSSTASSGSSNSTAVVTGNAQLAQIMTNALVNGASDSRQVDGGPRDALTGGSCAARANGASARASIVTVFNVPVNITGPTTVSSVASSFCEAGVSVKRAGTPGGNGLSSSGMQAALTDGGVKASVVCNGRSSVASPTTSFSLRAKGTYSGNSGFRGNFTVTRSASAQTSCS